ncbi:MAG: hypothetical protein CL802_13580 [Citromicrobium sp.]|nr:hypothetical protein [Citromicrobium sp.]|tara:strand:- start:2418 stop:4292 length:1875 start_codon:yes stop_codon:yes gene_type:complete
MRAARAHPAPDAVPDGAAEVERERPRFPEPCPVVMLGVYGKNLVFLDRLHQIVMEPPRGCGKGELALWFGDKYLIEYFTQFPKGWKPGDPDPEDFNQSKAQMALIADCHAKGIFNPEGKVLGRGAHRPQADEEALVLHMGSRVLLANMPDAKGKRSGDVKYGPSGMVKIAGKETFFPADASLPPPADKPAQRAEAEELLAVLATWNWVDPKAGPLLMLGWIAQSYICGALLWRAHIWLPGPTGCGKSTLQKIIRALHDEWMLVTSDATEAWIRQKLQNDTLPVSIDEAEAHDNPERLAAIMNLVKKSSTGDVIGRGGADHKSKDFTARSCFLLSSVIHATLRGEDRNRIALLDLRPLPEHQEPLEMELAKWRSTGRRFHRRMIEQWPRFDRTLAAYKRAIGAQRFDSRWQDTYGTLLACADLLLYDYAPDAPEVEDEFLPDMEPGMSRVQEAVVAILPLMVRGKSEARTDTERVSRVLMSYPIPGAHGAAPEPIGTWIDRALTVSKMMDNDSPGEDGINHGARNRLKGYGLRVVEVEEKPGGKQGIVDARAGDVGWEKGYLAVAYPTNKGITEIFNRSDWQGDGYLQSLRKLPGTIGPKKVRFGGKMPDNALLVPLKALMEDEG